LLQALASMQHEVKAATGGHGCSPWLATGGHVRWHGLAASVKAPGGVGVGGGQLGPGRCGAGERDSGTW
jgi:hypothetical protein